MPQLITEHSKGIFPVAPTPFTADGSLDFESTERLISFYEACGVAGLTILGVMGEASKLTFTEAVEFASFVIARCPARMQVVVGTGTMGPADLEVFAARMMEAGAAGLMIAPPQGSRTDEQILAALETVAALLPGGTPAMLQDYPPSSGVYLSVPLLRQVFDGLPQFVGLKHEDCPGLSKLSRLRRETATGGMRTITILIGNGGLYFPQELSRGADGAATGFSYPEMLVQVYDAFLAGREDEAEDIFDMYLPLVRHEQQPGYGLAVRKYILHRRGVLHTPFARRPSPSLSPDDTREIDQLMGRLERKLAEKMPLGNGVGGLRV